MWDIDGIMMALSGLADSEDGIFATAYARDMGDDVWKVNIGAHGDYKKLQYLIGDLIARIED